MLTELLTVVTADGKSLDGALYKPPAALNSNRGVLLLHGLTWNFYQGPSRWLPPLLTPQGFTCLSLNTRDHDLDKPVDFELSYHDLKIGLDALRAEGVDDITLLAHGYGCNKAVSYTRQSGDDSLRSYVLATLGSVKGYRPDIWDDVLAKAPAMKGRALVVQGASDTLLEPKPRADDLVAAAGGCAVEVVLLEGADHYFDATQQQLADSILAWLNAEHSKGGQ